MSWLTQGFYSAYLDRSSISTENDNFNLQRYLVVMAVSLQLCCSGLFGVGMRWRTNFRIVWHFKGGNVWLHTWVISTDFLSSFCHRRCSYWKHAATHHRLTLTPNCISISLMQLLRQHLVEVSLLKPFWGWEYVLIRTMTPSLLCSWDNGGDWRHWCKSKLPLTNTNSVTMFVI